MKKIITKSEELKNKIKNLKEEQDWQFDEKKQGCKYNRNRYNEIYGESLKRMEQELESLKTGAKTE